MKRYAVTLDEAERNELTEITSKGSHRSRNVINDLILLNCDAGDFNDRQSTGEANADILRISTRRVDRVKRRFVEEGLDAALACGDPPEGHSQWSLRLLADRVVELGYIDAVSHETVRRVLKKRTQAMAADRMGDSAAGKCRLRRHDGDGVLEIHGQALLPVFAHFGEQGIAGPERSRVMAVRLKWA